MYMRARNYSLHRYVEKYVDGGRVGGQPEVVWATGLGFRFARRHFRDRQMQR